LRILVFVDWEWQQQLLARMAHPGPRSPISRQRHLRAGTAYKIAAILQEGPAVSSRDGGGAEVG
jgi:hypothetical protein